MSSTDNTKSPWVETIRPRPAWFRWCLRWILYAAVHSIAFIDIKGREFIPREGPFIVVANHFTIWEPPLMVYTIPQPLTILAAGDLNWPLTQAWALWLYGYIPTNREAFKPSTIREAKKALQSDSALGIFPEAGMSPNFQLQPGKPGAVYLSDLAGCKILPVGFSGYEHPEKYWKNLHRARYRIRIGQPFGPYNLSDDTDMKKMEMQEYSHDIMRHIAALLPKHWRGYYRKDSEVEGYVQYDFTGNPPD